MKLNHAQQILKLCVDLFHILIITCASYCLYHSTHGISWIFPKMCSSASVDSWKIFKLQKRPRVLVNNQATLLAAFDLVLRKCLIQYQWLAFSMITAWTISPNLSAICFISSSIFSTLSIFTVNTKIAKSQQTGLQHTTVYFFNLVQKSNFVLFFKKQSCAYLVTILFFVVCLWLYKVSGLAELERTPRITRKSWKT